MTELNLEEIIKRKREEIKKKEELRRLEEMKRRAGEERLQLERERSQRNDRIKRYATRGVIITFAIGALAFATYFGYKPIKTTLEKNKIERVEKQKLIDSLAMIIPEGDIPKIVRDNYTVKSGVYNIDHNIIVIDSGILTLYPDVTINFKDLNNGIQVKSGTLNILGKLRHPVILDAQQDRKNGVAIERWSGITILDSHNDNVIEYATIRRAESKLGGGLRTINSRLRLSNSTIEQCVATGKKIGGGMFNGDNSNVKITVSKIIDNTGSGIYNNKSMVSIENSVISKNVTESNGGGIYNEYSDVKLISGYITQNQAKSGGGIYSSNSEVEIDRTKITGNIAKKRGGGIYSKKSKNTLKDVYMALNSVPVGLKLFDKGKSIYKDSESEFTYLGKNNIEDNTDKPDTSDKTYIANQNKVSQPPAKPRDEPSASVPNTQSLEKRSSLNHKLTTIQQTTPLETVLKSARR